MTKLSIRARFLLVIMTLATIPIVGVAVSSYGLYLSERVSDQRKLATEGSEYLERINGKIYAIVMDSRGIYMSADSISASPYAAGVNRRLSEIQAVMTLWQNRAIESERPRIEAASAAIKEFISFRRELARLAQQDGVAAAREYGDNDDNHNNRTALNKELTALRSSYDDHVAAAEREAERIAWFNRTILFSMAALAFVTLIGGALFAVRAASAQSKLLTSLETGLKGLAKGDLSYRLDDHGSREYEALTHDYNSAMDRVAETILAISKAANEVANAADEIISETKELSERTEQQAVALEQTSASAEQVVVTVRQNAENAAKADEFATRTSGVAEANGRAVVQAITTMSRIESSSTKINDIVAVIDEIARQTNLLALNAAVEAARAGDAGRGFAVVAGEVRVLAQRSADAARDIKKLIAASTDDVHEGVSQVKSAGAALNEIVTSVQTVANIISEISNSSSQQADGMEQISQALAQIDNATQSNTDMVQQGAKSAAALMRQVRIMRDRMSFFRADDARLSEVLTETDAREAAVMRQRKAG